MRKKSPFTQSFEQLPSTLPIFPLSGAVVLPGGALPLNIFEPRYLKMVHDAMKSDQLIGMIQPQDELATPTLYNTGCAARIIQYSETKDGRLEIALEGLCRFDINEEMSCMRGYRLIKPNWANYEHDFSKQAPANVQDKLLFIASLRTYFTKNGIDVDWAVIEELPQQTLVNNLIQQLSLSAEDKQLLIEADNLRDRVKSFTSILVNNTSDSTTRH